jgi:hypothetical protein
MVSWWERIVGSAISSNRYVTMRLCNWQYICMPNYGTIFLSSGLIERFILIQRTDLAYSLSEFKSIASVLSPLTSKMVGAHPHKLTSRVFKDFMANLKTSRSASYTSSPCVLGSFFFNAMPTITGRRDISERLSEAVTQIKVAA